MDPSADNTDSASVSDAGAAQLAPGVESCAAPSGSDAPPGAAPALVPSCCSPAWAWGLAAIAILTLAVLFAEPVRDGDLWWHLAYGRHMVENRTLIPDHTLYTWTPTEADANYCAWLPEIMLYGGHLLGGLPLLFAFRYLCMLAFVFLVWRHARRRGVAAHPVTWLICLTGVLMSYCAAHLKQEIVSYVLMSLTAATWMRLKSSDEKAWRWCWLLPVLMALWVNSHGGCIFGLFFLAVILVGEEMNALYCPRAALPLRTRRHLFLAILASGLTICVTPYGLAYPIQLVRSLLDPALQGVVDPIDAYKSIFAPRTGRLHFVQYLALAGAMLLALGALVRRSHGIDWALILANVGFAVLYGRFLRCTFYWAPIFALSAVHLLAAVPGRLRPRRRATANIAAAAVALLVLGLSGRAVYESAVDPVTDRWLGFGASCLNPVEEAEFIAANLAGCRLGNDYVSGGYLLWRLWPETKVFIDPRQFPFRKWYAAYRAFEAGQSRELLALHPCEAWCIQYRYHRPLKWLTNSPEWTPLFYGPVAVVFGRTDAAGKTAPPIRGPGIGRIRNLDQALLVLTFALNIGDSEGVRIIVDGMQARFRWPAQRRVVAKAVNLVEGMRAYGAGDYETAAELLDPDKQHKLARTHIPCGKCWQHVAGRHWEKKDYQAALEASLRARELMPDDLLSVYNVAVARWMLARQAVDPEARSGAPASAPAWRADLALFVKRATGRPGIPRASVAIAKSILAGTHQVRPPLLVPPKPEA